MQIKKVGVVGCGQMGSGIAQMAAMAGFEVVVLDKSKTILDQCFSVIEKSLAKFAEKGTLKEAPQAIRSRIKGTLKIQDFEECDLVTEAIIENLAEKERVYAELEGVVKPDTIFATNTSSISITELAVETDRPERFVGLHFFNPVPMMKLVEVVRTMSTSDETFDIAVDFVKKLGKLPIRTNDNCGFIVNRLLIPYLLDAVRALEEGLGSLEDIDNGMKLGCGYPMGPFTLLDFVGLDTVYYVSNIMYNDFKERRFAAPPLLKRMVTAGWYGRKSGKGFYDYADPNNPKPNKF